MDKFEYKIEFESDFDKVFDVINKISDTITNSEFKDVCTNMKFTFTILDDDGGIEFSSAF